MTPYFRAFLTVLSAIVLGVTLAVSMTGCATTPAKPKDPPIVAAFVFFDHCDQSFVEAAFVRADGSIFETQDEPEALKLNDSLGNKKHGLLVPFYNGPCQESM